LKILFLQTHYSHPVDFSWEKMEEAKKARERFQILFEKLEKVKDQRSIVKNVEVDSFKVRFETAMDDDFNTAEALATLFDLATYINKEYIEASYAKDILIELGKVFGLFEHMGCGIDSSRKEEIEKLIDLRNTARKNKDFKEADKIREKLSKIGIIVEDQKGETTWRIK